MAKIKNLAERQGMIDICRKMNASGINQGTSGNLSLRLDDNRFLVTPSSLPYDTMKPEDIVEMDFDGTYVGPRPSSEWRFHRDILAHRKDIDVVLHCHSVYATTLAVHHMTIPSFHYMTGVAGGKTIRCSAYATFGTQALSDAAIEALEGRLACLLGQHGQISLGKTLDKALWLATEVETISRLYVQALTLGDPPILSDEEMDRVLAQMERMSYGMGPEPEGSNDAARPLQKVRGSARKAKAGAARKAKAGVARKAKTGVARKAKAKPAARPAARKAAKAKPARKAGRRA